jgi:hypothetical protein
MPPARTLNVAEQAALRRPAPTKGYGLHVHHRKPKMPGSTKRITSKKEKISPRIFQTMNTKSRTDPASNLS